MSEIDSIIRVDGVSKSFGQVQVIRDLSFSIKPGEIVGILGPNGAGKTTTVRLINGVISPDSGTISVLGKNPVTDGEAVRARTGVLTETAGLYGEMTAEENLLFFADIYGVSDPRPRVIDILRDLGMESYKARKVGAYSTGMRKRLGIAKALLHRPEILFLDEPTTGLDPEGARSLLEYIQKLNQEQNVTILLATHLLQQVENLCHRFIFLHQGQKIEEATLRQLEERYLTDFSLKVETDMKFDSADYRGYPIVSREPGRVVFRVASKAEVSPLLRQLLQEGAVFSAEIVGRDLETLYFSVRQAVKGEGQ